MSSRYIFMPLGPSWHHSHFSPYLQISPNRAFNVTYLKMSQFTIDALKNLSTLSSEQKTALIASIAQEMITTMRMISEEINRGTLDPDNTAPLDNFIGTIQVHERAQQRKLERKLARYRQCARLQRAEGLEIRRKIAEMVRRLQVLHQRQNLDARVEETKGSRSESGSGGGESRSAQ
ncbi:hypothetical protein BDW62DRAFT_111732 [Aspergillus aurantiobrunneus]